MRMVRTEEAKRVRKEYEAHRVHHGYNELKKPELRQVGQSVSNTLSTVTKDNLLCEVRSCAIRTRHYCGKDKRIEMGNEVANSITTVQKDSMVSLAEDEQIKFDFCASSGKKNGNEKDELKKDAIKKKKIRIRRLTPSECLRLMGFDDADFFKAKEVNCDSNLYQQAGNSIVTDCIYHMLLPMVSGHESGVPCKHDWRK